ncbi:MAG TPA: hypothetical protein VGB87_12850, partial [Vicinamibacteria bacterium]
MIRDRLRRFRHIERARPAGADPGPAAAPERFGRVEGPGAGPAEPAVPASATDRFRPPRERPLEVAERPDGEQPFRRCARCEMDNARFAEACQNCGADLGTPEQQVFNERLWARRREEAAEEARGLAERERERARLGAEEQRARRELAAEMARREANRVEGELGDAWGGDRWGRRRWGYDPDRPYDPDASWGGPPRGPLGLRLLRAIKNPVLRIAVIVVAVAVPVLLLVLGPRNGGARFAGMILLVVILGLMSPPG